LPVRAYRIERVVDALRHMARAEHIGKVVIQAAAPTDSADRGLALRDDGTYLVTGGLGGLGLKVARWLADRGARHLVLVGRSAASAEARRQLDELEKTGVRVVVRHGDVGDPATVSALLSEIRGELPPLRGIFHLAGKQGALAYQSLRGDSGMPAAQIARETTQQRLSLLVFIALLLLGALIAGVGAAVARRRRAP
jgi:NAD(P)-dependent dehydrogenase (short-subunit alcohol dehydrogenase family)